MNTIKTNQIAILLSILMTVLCCKALLAQTSWPQLENNLTDELDYTEEGLSFTIEQQNGEMITGKIDKKGKINFNLPDFDIKGLYDSIPLQHYNFQSLFLMQSCAGKDPFDETPFDAIYAQKYDRIYIEKYGIKVAVLYAVSNEKIPSNNRYSNVDPSPGSSYHWFYIDRAIDFNEKCIKTSFEGTYDIEVDISANIQFKKGWNFIKEELLETQKFTKGDYNALRPKKIRFTSTSPVAKEVKWFLKKITEDEKIQAAKRLYGLTPITKEQFKMWAPNKLGDLALKTKDYGNPPKGQKNKNCIHLTYANETQQSEIDLYVVDYSRNPGDIEMIDFAYAMENDGKDEEEIKPYVAQYSEREKATKLLYKVEDRMFVTASGVNIGGEALWAYIKKMNFEKLLQN